METIQKIQITPNTDYSKCYHCGDPNPSDNIRIGEKVFCCNGCKLVYELLEENDLCNYYNYEQMPGISPDEAGSSTKFKYLEDESIKAMLINFTDGNTSTVTLSIPAMHCASCVWLLESLYKLNPLIISSKVDYLRKELTISYEETAGSLRQVVELLSSIGYEPEINLDSLQQNIDKEENRDLYIKIGVAGFCFANIMMLSFPDYLANQDPVEAQIGVVFRYLSMFLSLPVLLYSSADYFKSALNGWKQRSINMDVPISLGILALFLRSFYEIITGAGAGYLDSFTGLVFLLLIGKLFEKKTYNTLSFERDYRSYFPVSVTKKTEREETTISLDKLNIGDRIIIRNQELIPADSILIRGDAYIDYSFVTGESKPVAKKSGDLIYAGGKQVGSSLELDVIKDVNQSYLTELWNDDSFIKNYKSKLTTAANTVSRYFTIIVLSIASLSAIYWFRVSSSLALNAFTAVLIVACPCALALSTPFTLGNTLRIFGRNKFYIKNTAVIESLSKITDVVFDKTGTITRSRNAQVEFVPAPNMPEKLSKREIQFIQALSRQSMHPLSRQIFESFKEKHIKSVSGFDEIPGQGIKGLIDSIEIRLGSENFLGINGGLKDKQSSTFTFLSIGRIYRGYFKIVNAYRDDLQHTIEKIYEKYNVNLITGDDDHEKNNLLKFFKSAHRLNFKQTPFDKLEFVKKLQRNNKRVLMIGDGLNDAGALKQSDAGITISEDLNTFSPASDAILSAEKFNRLTDFLKFSKKSMHIIVVSFIISFVYNIVGLGFAVQGTLSPLIAAVLMPLSSITVVLFTTGATTLAAKSMGFSIIGENR